MKQKKQCRYCGSYSSDSLRRCCNAGHVEDRDLAEVEAAGRRAAQRTQVGEHLKGTRRAAHDGVVILRASVELRSARQNGHCTSDFAAVFARVVTACEKAAEKALVDAMAKEHRAAKDAGIAVFIAKPMVEQDVKRILVPERPCQKAAVAMDYMLRDKQVLRPKARAENAPIANAAYDAARRAQSADGLAIDAQAPYAVCKACGGSREVQDSTPVAYDDGVYHPWCRRQKEKATAAAPNTKLCVGCTLPGDRSQNLVMYADGGVDRLFHPLCFAKKQGWSE
jgi:hypothetical protein